MNADTSDIHRLLDEAFAGVTMTPELQDLKEELRGNLPARSAELQGRGVDATAARTAAAELGDIPELIASVGDAPDRQHLSQGEAAAQAARLHRVRPKPAFVLRATFLSLVVATSAVLLVVFALSSGDPSRAVCWSPMACGRRPRRASRFRAAGYGLAAYVAACRLADRGQQALGDRFAVHLRVPLQQLLERRLRGGVQFHCRRRLNPVDELRAGTAWMLLVTEGHHAPSPRSRMPV